MSSQAGYLAHGNLKNKSKLQDTSKRGITDPDERSVNTKV